MAKAKAGRRIKTMAEWMELEREKDGDLGLGTGDHEFKIGSTKF